MYIYSGKIYTCTNITFSLSTGRNVAKVAPFAIRKMLNWIKNEYGNPPIYITSGISDMNGTLADEHRIHFYRTYINNILKGKILVWWAFNIQGDQESNLNNC